MALNAADTLGIPEAEVQPLRKLAYALLTERMEHERKMGGLTPAAFQDLAGQWAQQLNPGFARASFSDMLRGIAHDLDTATYSPMDPGPADYGAGLLMLAFHHAYINAYDLLEAGYTNFDIALQDVITITGEEDQL